MWPLLAPWLSASRCQPRRCRPKLIDVARTADWRQSTGPKWDSRPRLEGVCYQVPDKLLTPTQPYLTLQSRIHLHTSLTKTPPFPGLAQWACYKKASAYGSRVGWTPARRNRTEQNKVNTRHKSEYRALADISHSRYVVIATKLMNRLQIHPIVHN